MKRCHRNFKVLLLLLTICIIMCCLLSQLLSLHTTVHNVHKDALANSAFNKLASKHDMNLHSSNKVEPGHLNELGKKIRFNPMHQTDDRTINDKKNERSPLFTDDDNSQNQRDLEYRENLRSIRAELFQGVEESLREFQSAQEEWRRIYELLLNSQDTSPPNLTQENCTQLIQNARDGKHRNSSKNKLTTDSHTTTAHSRQPRSFRELLDLTENCTRYVLDAGFRFAHVTEEELSFPLAFSLVVHKDLEQVERLLRAVYRPHNVYCVHADHKANNLFHAGLRLLVGCLPNVVMAESSVDVQWGQISVLEPEMQCMRQLLNHKAPWRYFINLTGQEFPLKTNREMVRILTLLKGANIISGTTDKKYEFRWKNSKPVPYNLTMNKGDVHIIASRGYVDYVINSRVARELFEWLRGSFIPDESFFNTLNYNPQLGVPGSYVGPADKRVKETIRSLKIWSFSPNRDLCAGKWVRMICQFGVGDLPTLTSSPFLIANKFSYDFQPLAYDCVEKWHMDKVQQENLELSTPSLNLSLYHDSPMVRYRYTGPVLIWG